MVDVAVGVLIFFQKLYQKSAGESRRSLGIFFDEIESGRKYRLIVPVHSGMINTVGCFLFREDVVFEDLFIGEEIDHCRTGQGDFFQDLLNEFDSFFTAVSLVSRSGFSVFDDVVFAIIFDRTTFIETDFAVFEVPITIAVGCNAGEGEVNFGVFDLPPSEVILEDAILIERYLSVAFSLNVTFPSVVFHQP